MKAYHYDAHRFFDVEINCQRDPLESEKAGNDIYLTPADTTDVEPTIVVGSTPRWNGTEWEQYPDDKVVYGYTSNDDGTINYYGNAHIEEELQARNKSVELLFTDTEPVSVNGVYWLSADDPAYIEAKTAADKEQAIAELDAQYNADKADLLTAYQAAMVYGDSGAMAKLKNDLAALDDKYDADYAKIEGEE